MMHNKGISKLVEETGELSEILGKISAAGFGISPYTGINLTERLQEELADVLASIDFLIEKNNLNDDEIQKRRRMKYCKFVKWDIQDD